MRRLRSDPDVPLRNEARKWAEERAGVKLVWANQVDEPGARWIRYHPQPFLEVFCEGNNIGKGCWMLLRPSRAKRYTRRK